MAEELLKADESVFNKAEQEFYMWVDLQIKSMDNRRKMLSNPDPSYDEINAAIVECSNVIDGLNSLYTTMKMKVTVEKDKFDIWYAQAFMRTRELTNSQLDRKVWYSQDEMKQKTIADNAEEIMKRKAAIDSLEAKRSYLERKVETWRSYSFMLNTLSKNINSQVYAEMKGSDAGELI